jgi:hypothetical protein
MPRNSNKKLRVKAAKAAQRVDAKAAAKKHVARKAAKGKAR